ncbi:NUDIX hydrolase [Rubrivivax sp. A210]|uniref:MBL fold metallo-hydrolase n=1 Tax=Rubrivivax sp. A210 TaxID=2772301 RepID=UPI001919269A|nr:MBL fold metallo-hydrolase [Rubrivivax sp. A210]CAD5374878.1 NUDIX hydrolase [Rubrivivax sp. A210]
MSGHATPADARRAASLLLLRDGADGLEVLMLRRAEREGDHRGGAAVFPGGVLDARDREAHGLCDGADDAGTSARLGLRQGGLDYVVAALRETFEEVGLLLANGSFDLAALQPWRNRLQDGSAGIAEFCAAAGLRLDAAALVYHSHWLTPPGMAKRFDTRFFAAHAPAGQEAQADGGEAQALMWLAPRAALDPALGLKLLPVTQRTLQDLARSATAEAALAEARARRDIPLIMPRAATSSRGRRTVMPDELPYAEIARLDPEGRGDVSCELRPGAPVRLSPTILRLTAPNPGPMTGPGTNSYLVGAPGAWTVIDPGPLSESHLQALLAAGAGGITRILVTHTHRDHSPGAAALAQVTGAPVLGRIARHPQWQEEGFAPTIELQGGERLPLPGGAHLRVIHTPGHASNHLCYLLEEERTLFTGDHVMQGSTVVINPPDGEMAAYLAALRGLLELDLEWLAPGHGFLVGAPQAAVRALIAHRLRREAKVLEQLHAASPLAIEALLPLVYDDVPPARHAMAERSLLAHLLKLEAEGAVYRDGERWVSAGG